MTGILFISFVVRVIYLEAPSFWVDEAISRYRAQITPVQMITELGFDQMPLYYLILEMWVKLVGSSVFSLRFLSVLLGTLVVSQIYFLGKRLYSETTAKVAACIVGISPFLIFYSRMARAYPLLWFFVLLAINKYLHAIQEKTWRAWLFYAVAATAAAYTHFTALPILGFLGLYTLLLQRKQLKTQWDRWFTAHLFLLLAFVPFMSRFFGMVLEQSSTAMSRGSLSLWYLADIFVSWNLGHAFKTTKLTFLLSVLSFGLVTAIGALSIRCRSAVKSSLRTSVTRLSILPRLRWRGPEVFLLGCSLSLLFLAISAKVLNPDRLSFSMTFDR